MELRVQIEAILDFPDEELGSDQNELLTGRLRDVSLRVGTILEGSSKGRLLSDGAKVTLLGRPNVGKSSIMNRLAKEDVAIVTEIPGTTRDALRESVRVGDVPLVLSDTAGIRETTDIVEMLGVGKALDEVSSADLVLVITEATRGIEKEDVALAEKIPHGKKYIWVQNKIDLVEPYSDCADFCGHPVIGISAKTMFGMERLERAILESLGCVDLDDGVFSARERHLVFLRVVDQAIKRAISAGSLELVAEDLRRAQDALGALVGEFTSDDLLGEIFSRFCIGK